MLKLQLTSIIAIFSCLFILSCVVVKTKKLTFKDQYQLVDPRVKTQGFYYTQHPNSMGVMVFFENGYLYESSYSNLESAKSILPESLKDSKSGWGCYIISGDTIRIQYFEPQGNELKVVWDVNEAKGIITNQNLQFASLTYKFYDFPIVHDGKNWLMDSNK